MNKLDLTECFNKHAWTNIWNTEKFEYLLTQTSSIEIERVCDRADECILETAAISVAPVHGGPEQLVIFVVLKKGSSIEPDKQKILFSRTIIQSNLNPLFKVWLKTFFFFLWLTISFTFTIIWPFLRYQILAQNWRVIFEIFSNQIILNGKIKYSDVTTVTNLCFVCFVEKYF